jgi:predicted GNAT family N-acyltransferase
MAVRLIDRLSDKQVEELTALYQKEWWCQGRRLEDVRRMLAAADLVFAFEDADRKELVAFARVLTDTVYRAYLFDVIVKESHRGHGVGRAIVEAVVKHPTLTRIEKLFLWCRPELVPFYEEFGFVIDSNPDIRVMVRSWPGAGAA